MTKRSPNRRRKRGGSPLPAAAFGLVLLIGGLAIAGQLRRGGPPQDLLTIPAEVNYPAPVLELESVYGEVQSLEDFAGQVVLVNNWATWCPPCKAELPTLVAFHEAHAAEGFTLIGIEAGEPASEVIPFVEQFEISYPVWLDPQNRALAAFNNPSLPNSYVIDREGTVRLTWTGEISRAALEEYVTPLIVEN